jgi:hypothetical protein
MIKAVRYGVARGPLGWLGSKQIRFVSPVAARTEQPLVARVYRQLERDFGLLAPPVALHAGAPETLAACWTMLRETMVVPGLVPRSTKEAVATAVSAANACTYCVAVHNATFDVFLGRRSAETVDPATESITAWAAGGERPTNPVPAEHIPELVGVATLLHYLNRMVTLFLLDVPLPPGVPGIALGRVSHVLGRVIREAADRGPEPGASLDLLPPAPFCPVDLAWTAGNATIAEAFVRASHAIERAGEHSVAEPVRALLTAELAGWRGEKRGPSRAWVDTAVLPLPVEHRAAGRLALLTAFAPYQADDSIIDACHHGDQTLLELTSWAGMAAARHLGARMWRASVRG